MPGGILKNPKPRACEICGTEFIPRHPTHRFCSKPCKRVKARQTGCESTDSQYSLISGNWDKYYNRLRCQKGRTGISLKELLDLHEKQRGLCALSGREMTCVLVKGEKSQTNASLDRIEPKGPYVIENVQLVCTALNRFRVDTSVSDFVQWCKEVADHALQKS